MLSKKTVKDIELRGNKVLVRVDFNVPLEDGEVMDDTRIQAALPTIQHLLDRDAAVILCSHLGRPKGEVDLNFSLRPVGEYLAELLGKEVKFSEDCIGATAKEAARSLEVGEVLLLENTRFHPGEKANDPEMARQLAILAEVFVNDAFGSAHRAHASTVGVAEKLPAVAGLLMEKEILYLGQVIAEPEYPFVVILGGAKISDKIGVIENLLGMADKILIGGGMANTFFKAQGFNMGDSLVEEDAVSTAEMLLKKAKNKVQLPVDVVLADEFSENAEAKTAPVRNIPDGWRILDIGEETVRLFSQEIINAKTVVWNGPMGVFEFEKFAKGTFGIAQAVADCSGLTIVGGGDSAAAVKQSGLADKIKHISTGGGASLMMLEGKTLPGLAALMDK